MSYVVGELECMERTGNGFSCGINHFGSADTDTVIVITITFFPFAVNARQDSDS